MSNNSLYICHRIYIRRDFTTIGGVRFDPDDCPDTIRYRLNNNIDQWSLTITELNRLLADIEDESNNMIDELIGCASCYAICTNGHRYNAALRRVVDYINQQNTDIYRLAAIEIANPIKYQLRAIEVNIMQTERCARIGCKCWKRKRTITNDSDQIIIDAPKSNLLQIFHQILRKTGILSHKKSV
jgi:hypothetical protein